MSETVLNQIMRYEKFATNVLGLLIGVLPVFFLGTHLNQFIFGYFGDTSPNEQTNALPSAESEVASSSIVYIDNAGCLRYVMDEEHNVIPDFSYAGYRNGDASLPTAQVVTTIAPIAGDNTAHIQNALDQVGEMTPNGQGIRGALLLEPGLYEVHGTIMIRDDGVILRGSGEGADPSTSSILLGVGNAPADRDIVQAGNAPGVNWTSAQSGSTSAIISDFIPVGSRSLKVASPQLYSSGDNVIIIHPSTNSWLQSINYGDTEGDAPWSPGEIDIYYNRYISSVDMQEGKIVLDAPIYDHFDRSLSQASVYILNEPDIKRKIGIENLRIDIQTTGEMDENHAQNAIRLIGVEDCWVKNVTALHFSYAAIDMKIASRVTIKDCSGLEPHSKIEGSRRYNFKLSEKSNNILFDNCVASDARHAFVSNGTSSVSGIVFYNCSASGDYTTSEGHRRWSQALLFDNTSFSNPRSNNLLGLYNRGNYGTGHGWAAVHSVAWNVSLPSSKRIVLQKPPNRQNYAIGCQAVITHIHQFVFPPGFSEMTNSNPGINSLYSTQKQKRASKGVSPDPPAKLTAAFDGSGVILSWLDVASRETAYVIEYSQDGGQSYNELATIPADETTYTHSDLPAGTDTLKYRVFALGTSCPSSYSPPVQVVTAGVLPVELISSDLRLKSGVIVVEWTTASEVNASHFEVERKVGEGMFQFVGSVSARGFESTETTYHFLDSIHPAGRLYYRIILVDLDASFSYSQIMDIYLDPESDFKVHPNPATGAIELHIPPTVTIGTLEITDLGGNFLLNRTISNHSEPHVPIRVDLAGIPRGVVILRVRSSQDLLVRKLILL